MLCMRNCQSVERKQRRGVQAWFRSLVLRANGGSAELDADFLAALITKGRRSVRGKDCAEGGPPGSVPNELLPADASQYLKARRSVNSACMTAFQTISCHAIWSVDGVAHSKRCLPAMHVMLHAVHLAGPRMLRSRDTPSVLAQRAGSALGDRHVPIRRLRRLPICLRALPADRRQPAGRARSRSVVHRAAGACHTCCRSAVPCLS